MLSPAMSEALPPVLMQLPFLRCLFMGRASVAAFAILSGFVNALKPIQQTRAGHSDAALSSIAKSAFRRTGRFIIPAMAATTLSWLICQFGGYGLAQGVESAWIRDTSPLPSTSFAGAFTDLFRNLIRTWTDGLNEYDRVQWTLPFLLRGSMLVYLTMLATAYVLPKRRMLVYAIMYCYYWKTGDGRRPDNPNTRYKLMKILAVIGINVYAGMLLAELTFDPDVQEYVSEHQHTFSLLSSLFIFLGIFVISYPEENPEWARWSTALLWFGYKIFPVGSEFSRFYPALGTGLIIFGVGFNSTAKRALCHPALCWLGKMSFAVYLIHAPLIRTLLTWMLYGASSSLWVPVKDEQDKNLPPHWIQLTSPWLLIIALPAFFFLLYRLAQLWMAYIDPWCARVTDWIEEQAFRDEVKLEKSLLLA